MANSSTASNSMLVAEFDATGASSEIKVRGSKLVDICINMSTGSFDGTIELQGEFRTGSGNAYEWRQIGDFQTNDAGVYVPGDERALRLNCLTYVSGTARCEMTAGNASVSNYALTYLFAGEADEGLLLWQTGDAILAEGSDRIRYI